MFKMKKLPLALLMSATLFGCANIGESYRANLNDYKNYTEIAKQYNVKDNWWTLYNDSQLNHLVDQALTNNKDLAKAGIAVNKALYNANLVGANLVPTFSGSVSSKNASKNINAGDNSKISHGGALNVSYTLDLWRRLADAASAAEWEHEATIQDLEAARLSLINSVVTTYYQIAYLNDAINAIQDSVKYYTEIGNIMQRRLTQGVADRTNVDQAEQAVLAARNNLINYQTQRKTAEQTLRNLLNLKPDETLNIHFPHIMEVKIVGVNLNVPVSVIANRPDVKGYQYRLSRAFKNAKSVEKSWFPEITLGGSLGSTGTRVDNAFNTPIAGGNVGISLPFLSWNTVYWNVKISEADYETARLNYEQAITTALNDVDTRYFAFTQSQNNLINQEKSHQYNKRITQYYRNRYSAGVSELREWLTAANTEKSSELSILNAKYSVIQNENAVYSAMAGYYSR